MRVLSLKLQTQAEIDMFTVNESLSDVQRIVYLLQKGTASQQSSAVACFRTLVTRRALTPDAAVLREPFDIIFVRIMT